MSESSRTDSRRVFDDGTHLCVYYYTGEQSWLAGAPHVCLTRDPIKVELKEVNATVEITNHNITEDTDLESDIEELTRIADEAARFNESDVI